MFSTTISAEVYRPSPKSHENSQRLQATYSSKFILRCFLQPGLQDYLDESEFWERLRKGGVLTSMLILLPLESRHDFSTTII